MGAEDYTMPEITTGMVQLGGSTLVHNIDIQHTDIVDYAPLLEISCLREDGQIQVLTFDESKRADILLEGTIARYWIDSYAFAMKLRTMTPAPAEGWYSDLGIDASGNFVSDGVTHGGYERADMNVAGNLVTSPDSVGYTFGGLDAYGNMSMVLNLNIWPRDMAIDTIKANKRSASSERTSLAR
jgi:hypothetical protein